MLVTDKNALENQKVVLCATWLIEDKRAVSRKLTKQVRTPKCSSWYDQTTARSHRRETFQFWNKVSPIPKVHLQIKQCNQTDPNQSSMAFMKFRLVRHAIGNCTRSQLTAPWHYELRFSHHLRSNLNVLGLKARKEHFFQ